MRAKLQNKELMVGVGCLLVINVLWDIGKMMPNSVT